VPIKGKRAQLGPGDVKARQETASLRDPCANLDAHCSTESDSVAFEISRGQSAGSAQQTSALCNDVFARRAVSLSAKNNCREWMFSAEHYDNRPTPAMSVIVKIGFSDNSVFGCRSDIFPIASKDTCVRLPQTHPSCVRGYMRRGPLFCL